MKIDKLLSSKKNFNEGIEQLQRLSDRVLPKNISKKLNGCDFVSDALIITAWLEKGFKEKRAPKNLQTIRICLCEPDCRYDIKLIGYGETFKNNQDMEFDDVVFRFNSDDEYAGSKVLKDLWEITDTHPKEKIRYLLRDTIFILYISLVMRFAFSIIPRRLVTGKHIVSIVVGWGDDTMPVRVAQIKPPVTPRGYH